MSSSRAPRRRPAPHVALSPVLSGNADSVVKALLCATDYGVLMTDHQGTDILCNPRFGELFNIDPDLVVRSTRDEVRRMALARVADPDAFTRLLERIYSDPTLEHTDEIDLITTPPRTLRRYTGPVRDSRGTNIGRVWTFQDVTETRRLQSEVNRYASRLQEEYRKQSGELGLTRLVLESLNAVSSSITARPETEQLVRLVAEEIAAPLCEDGHGCVALLCPETDGLLGGFLVRRGVNASVSRIQILASADTAVTEALESAGDGGLHFQLFADHDGPLARAMKSSDVVVVGLRWLSVTLGVLAFDARRGSGITDEAHRSHLEALLTHVSLALRIQRGRIELQRAYDDLRSAQDQVVESEKLAAVGVLAAGVAHDIRNIMTPLQLDLETARRGSDSITSGAVDSARMQVDRLATLTHRLLSIARPGRIQPLPVCIEELVSHLLPMVRGQAEIDGIDIRVRFGRGLRPVAGVAGQLEHLLINLILNALNAMQQTGGRLSLSASMDENQVRLDVRDTGRGIAREHLARIFEPFFTTRANGTGLGLVSVKRIVEQHNGRISVRSRAGRGACFSVWLPACPTEGETAHSQRRGGEYGRPSAAR